MKLSMWSSYYIDLNPYEMVLELNRIGCKYSELSDEHALMLLNENKDIKKTALKFKDFALKNNVKFLQGHLWLDIQLCNQEDDVLNKLKKWIDLFEYIGIKYMVLHLDDLVNNTNLTNKEKLDKNIEVLKQLVPFLENKKAVICLENLIDIVPNVDDLLYVINKLDSKHFAICLDTGHLNLTNKNQKEFILKANKDLKALHIADNEGIYDQHLMPFGRGNVDFKEVFKTLKEINYQGIVNLEIPGERNAPLEIRKLKFKYIKDSLNYLIKNLD